MAARPSPDEGQFGALLKRHRLAAGLTQEALAERAGLSAKAVSDLERDPARRPRLTTVGLLADTLGLAPAERAMLLARARPAGTAAAPAGATGRWVLPRPLTPLIGRAGVAAAIVELVRRGNTQLLTLTGPGGVGKTRLAIEVALRLTDDFPDGVAFVDLAPLRDPALVLGTIARHLDVDERDATPLHDRLAASLRGRRLLLVLDNLEHLLPAAAVDVLALLEACPGLAVLVTSRVALRVRAGYEYPIAPLALPDRTDPLKAVAQAPAVELFSERARAAGAQLSLDADTLPVVADICRRLDGLPLALELAAARVRLLPPTTLLARLHRRLAVLVAGPRDLPARQQTLRDAVAWSYELLNDVEQTIFRRLCVFVGGCTLDAAEAVCGKGAGDSTVLDGVTALVDNSLARVDVASGGLDGDDAGASPRLLLLETIREYGLERLEASAEHDAVRQRHAAHFVAVAEEAERGLAGPAGPTAMARLEREHDNLRAALLWAHRHDDAETALRLAATLWPFWHQRGHLSEGRRWLQDALKLPAADTVAPPVRVTALVGAARLAIDLAAHDEAATACARAVSLAREQADALPLVAALNMRGHLARDLSQYDDSLRDYEEARVRAHDARDRRGEAVALLGLAYVTMFGGDATTARALADESLAIARDCDDNRLVAEALFLGGWQAWHAGRYEHAEALGTEALHRWRWLGDTGETAEVLFGLGNVAMARREYEGAELLYQEALTLHRDRGDETHLSRDLSAVGTTALNRGDLARARSLLEESLRLDRRYDDRWGLAMSLTLLGHVELAAGDAGRALPLLSEAATVFQAIGNLLYFPWCLEGLAGVAAARGQHEYAARLDGARDAVQAQVGVVLHPLHPDGYANTLTAARTALPPERFDAARAAGKARPLDQTIPSDAWARDDKAAPS